MNNLKFYIIVPFHNVKQYLQTFKRNYENILKIGNVDLLLIDDHSTDNSKKLLDFEFKNVNSVKIMSCSKKGVSAARNFGLKYLYQTTVRSDEVWVTFCDFDDYIDQALFKSLKGKKFINDFDYILFGYSTNSLLIDRDVLTIVRPFKPTDPNEIAINGPFRRNTKTYNLNSPWGRVIKLSFLMNNNIFFNDSLTFREDLIFNLSIFSRFPRFGIVSKTYYYYCYNPKSVVHSFISNTIQQNQLAYECIKSLIVQKEDLKIKFLSQIFLQSIFVFVVPKGQFNEYLQSRRKFFQLRKDPIFIDLWTNNFYQKSKSKKDKLLLFFATKQLFLLIFVVVQLHNFILRK